VFRHTGQATERVVPTVLVADDNSNIQKMVTLALKDQGIDVIAVGNGEAAVRKLADPLPDLVLADIFMPVRNGYEVCEYVKKDERFAHIPVVLLVGAFDPLDEHEVERVHADGVLKKPFVPPDQLIGLVKSLLGRGASAAAVEAPSEEAPAEAASLQVEKTQQLTAAEIAKILEKKGRVPTPPVLPSGLEPDDYATRPAMIDIHTDEEAPVAFEDLLGSGESAKEEDHETAEKAEETHGASRASTGTVLDEAAHVEEAAAAEEEATEEEVAAINYEGIREEAKQPDPEQPPIPVNFGPSEPMEVITDEVVETSTVEVERSADLVTGAGDWLDSSAKQTAPVEAAPIAHAEEIEAAQPVHEEFPVAAEVHDESATAATIGDLDETTELPPHILEEEVRRAEEIAARVAAQNREQAAREKETGAFGVAAAGITGGSIAGAITAVDDLLARHMTQGAGAVREEAAAPPLQVNVPPLPLPEREPQAAVTAPPAEVPAAAAARPATSREELIEAVSERVLAQLDPYLIQKISREIIRPLVEALVKRELEKFE
jgi:CheY-like chemotaxis protein